jgi:hypothetical protein
MHQPLPQFHHSYTSPTCLAILFTVMLAVASNYKCFGLAHWGQRGLQWNTSGVISAIKGTSFQDHSIVRDEEMNSYIQHLCSWRQRPYTQYTFNKHLGGPQGHSRHSSKAEERQVLLCQQKCVRDCMPHIRWLGCWFLSTETRTHYACTSRGRFLSHAIITLMLHIHAVARGRLHMK